MINSYFSPVQSPFHLQQEMELESISIFVNETDACCNVDRDDQEDGLTASKSVESLNTLLTCLPDIVIPEPLYNPLPLQCLAANALPEAICKEIEQVLRECRSTMTTTASPKRLQDQESQACSSIVGSGSKIAGASVEEASVSIRGEEKALVAESTDGEKTVVSTEEVSVGDLKRVIKW